METPRHQLKEDRLLRRLSALGLFAILALFTAGCGEKNRSSAEDRGSKSNEGGSAKAAGKTPSPARGTEAEARAAVKTALDSWAFGDSEEQFKKTHPGIHLLDFNRITRKLGSYGIGTSRQDGKSFEFLVTLTYKEESGDVTRSGNYTVVKNAEGEWEIFGGAN